LTVLALSLLAISASSRAQRGPAPVSPILPENSITQVSQHVYVIMGFPNVAIVVGDRATLVVDTGMGPRNGATVVHAVDKLTKNPKIFLTTTHYHPEHSTGAQAFPAQTVLIRNKVQQEEMDRRGMEFIEMFRSRSELNRELLEGVVLRPPDVLFYSEATLDLGGITARLFWLGAAHTKGDELTMVEPDSVLIPGDIVQNKLVPGMPNEDSSVKGWLAILDKIEPLKPHYIVPDHGPLGDGSLIAQEKSFLLDIQQRALELKKQGKSVDEAGKLLAAEFKTKYSDWANLNNVPNVVKRVYAESEE
jgi:glyoxylase-like metal-dependent hydrolase (beta-lactamase superfamily II)